MLKRTMHFLMASAVLSFAQLAPVHADDTVKETQGINDTMKPYEANYVITRGDSEYGEGYRYLEVSPDDEWQLRTKSDISWFILSDTREARSVFIVDDESKRLEPREFIYMRTGTGSDKSFHGEFRADDKTVRNVDTGRMLDINWKDALFDEADEYRFRVMADSELLKLPYGKVEAIKVGRIRDNNRRQTFFWFAPELNYVMVKMQQFKEGDEQATMSLKSLEM